MGLFDEEPKEEKTTEKTVEKKVEKPAPAPAPAPVADEELEIKWKNFLRKMGRGYAPRPEGWGE
jgi:hypothetical protein